MHKTLLTLIGLAALTTPGLRAQEISMFNGRDLTGWKGLTAFWSVQDGAITGKITATKSPPGNTFLVWQGGDVSDFEFSCKFKLTPDNPNNKANSGVQFRARPTRDFGLKGYQGEMDTGALGNNGCLTDDPPGTKLAPPNEQAVASFRANDWNDFRIIALGTHLQVFVNGLKSADVTDSKNLFTSGQLGLQLHKGSGPCKVQFKDLKLRILTGSAPEVASAPGVTPATTLSVPAIVPAGVQTDANQARIEVLKEQGPNAVEWALAPLEQAVPGDIRQNLTFLREDLLDEGKQKPKASPAAYTLGSQICNTVLAALEERNQTLARAGFRAVEANARTGVTSQALEARRNYQMSWPQYARENAQRAELKSQAINSAAVMAERPKVEWATRTAALRKTLDTLYAQFREALRQSPAAK